MSSIYKRVELSEMLKAKLSKCYKNKKGDMLFNGGTIHSYVMNLTEQELKTIFEQIDKGYTIKVRLNIYGKCGMVYRNYYVDFKENK